MAQVTIRANLSAVQIPPLSEEFGPSVISRQQDLNYNPTLSSKADIDKDVGIPQIYYAHNVLPTNYGYRSVGYSLQIPAVSGVNDFESPFSFLSVTGQKASLAVTGSGAVYVSHLETDYAWQALAGLVKVVITEGTELLANTGTGYVVTAKAAPGISGDIYVATMTSATEFSVTKNAVAEATGTTGTEYVSADTKLRFTINGASTDFIVGDSFTLTASDATFLGAITTVALSGNTYLCSEGQGIYVYDFTANTLDWVYTAGLDQSALLGITACNGYLIAYSSDYIAWSSTIDPLDFIPSLSTGAGSGSVEDAKGAIRRCVGLTSGFLVFTAANCVAAIFSQNIRFPFVFREVPGAGGISDLSLVTDEADSTSVYAFTTYGLQQISTQKSQNVIAELSDMLTGRRFEDFDSDLIEFQVVNTESPLKKAINFISGRYLLISYGISSFTHSFVYDTALQRFGKLKAPHVAAYQYGVFDADNADTPKKQMALLTADGSVKTVEFAAGIEANDSVILLGKFQYIRSRNLQLHSVELETLDDDAEVEVYDLMTLDGKTYEAPIVGYSVPFGGLARTYRFRATGHNHSILVKGTFRLNSAVINFSVGGSR